MLCQQYTPRIHLSDSDFECFTEGMLDSSGQLGPIGFEVTNIIVITFCCCGVNGLEELIFFVVRAVSSV